MGEGDYRENEKKYNVVSRGREREREKGLSQQNEETRNERRAKNNFFFCFIFF